MKLQKKNMKKDIIGIKHYSVTCPHCKGIAEASQTDKKNMWLVSCLFCGYDKVKYAK